MVVGLAPTTALANETGDNNTTTSKILIKAVEDEGSATINDNIIFKITLDDTEYTGDITDEDGDNVIGKVANGKGSFLLKTGESAVIDGLPAETGYRIEERAHIWDEDELFDFELNNVYFQENNRLTDKETVEEDGTEIINNTVSGTTGTTAVPTVQTYTFLNYLDPKNVSSSTGSSGEVDTSTTSQIVIENTLDENSDPIDEVIYFVVKLEDTSFNGSILDWTSGEAIATINNGKATFGMKIGESAVINNVNPNTKYTIGEIISYEGLDNYSIYNVYYNSKDKKTGQSIEREEGTEIINDTVSRTTGSADRPTVQVYTFLTGLGQPDYGSQITLSYNLDDSSAYKAGAITFKITLDNTDYYGDVWDQDTYDSLGSVEDGVGTFTMKPNQKVCISGIPSGTKYTIKETSGSNYSLYKVQRSVLDATTEDGADVLKNVSASKNTVSGTLGSEEGWEDHTLVFSNYINRVMSLSKTSYTYDGKAKKPAVTVKTIKGKTVSSSKYTVKYSGNLKNVGTYKATVTFKDGYGTTLTKSYKVNPKGTSLSTLTKKSKSFTVKWKKQSKQTTGYQIQYSTSSKFSNAKTVTVSKNSTTSKTIKKLKGKKKYYVRVRTYKTVSGTKYYSGWSKAKSVTTYK
jgi:hypothetical protein